MIKDIFDNLLFRMKLFLLNNKNREIDKLKDWRKFLTENNKKKLLIVTDYYKPHISGITTSIDLLIKSLIKNNFQITILTGNYSGKLKDIEYLENIKIIRTKVLFKFDRGFFSFDLIKSFISESKKNDYINIHYPLAEIFPLIFFNKKKLIINYYCLPDYNSIFFKLIRLYFYIFGFISIIFSKKTVVFTNDYFESIFGHKNFKHKIIEIRPYVNDVSEIIENKYEDVNKKKILNIGFLGRLSEEKGLTDLIKASFVLEKNGVRHSLKIAGNINDQRFESHIKKLLILSKESKSIKFIGEISENEKINFFNSLDVFVLPSINSFESFGLVQLEAMMYGIPVIVSDLSGVRMPVYYTNNGYTFKRGNYKELANCLINIKNSKNLFDKKQIQNKCMKYFNEKEFTNRYLSLFN